MRVCLWEKSHSHVSLWVCSCIERVGRLIVLMTQIKAAIINPCGRIWETAMEKRKRRERNTTVHKIRREKSFHKSLPLRSSRKWGEETRTYLVQARHFLSLSLSFWRRNAYSDALSPHIICQNPPYKGSSSFQGFRSRLLPFELLTSIHNNKGKECRENTREKNILRLIPLTC